MKKLTLALMSLMLFLGMGAAFAQDPETPGNTLPKPEFTPQSGMISQGDEITVTLPSGIDFEEYTNSAVFVLYYFTADEEDVPTLEATERDLTAWATYSYNHQVEPSTAYKAGIYVDGDWTLSVTVPTTTEIGANYFYARLAAMMEDNSGETEIVYSDFVTSGYYVQEGGPVTPTELPLPTFDPASGEIEAGSTVKIEVEDEDLSIYYVINGSDEDLTLGNVTDAISYDGPIKLYKDATIKAVSVQTKGWSVSAVSEVATATYTVTGGENILPTLTLTPSESPVEVSGATTFSCTMDTKQYTASSNKIGFAIALENAGNIANLEYQVGETLDPDGTWTAYGERYLKGYGTGSYIAAIPNNGNPTGNSRLVAIAPTTVHYRITLNEGTSAKITFAVIEATATGTWPMDVTPTSVLAESPIQFASKPAIPTFDPEAGEVPFGTEVSLACATPGAKIYFTTDGTVPTEESEEYSWRSEIYVTEAMTVKAIAVNEGYASAVAEASYTVAPINAEVSITSAMLEGNTVGKNVGIGLTISDPENPESQMWVYTYPMSIYYTVDGTTEPSKAAYEAQSDKENGAIKMVAVKWEELSPVMDGDGNLMSVMFSEDTRFKAIGYMTMGEDQEVVTPVFNQELKVKAAENPTFSPANYTEIKAGDKLVVKNPSPLPVEDEEGEEGGDDFGGNPGEEETEAPVGTLYFSFDGTLPTSAGFYAQEEDWESEDGPYSNYKIFKAEGVDVEVIFGEDEDGLYAYVPVITEAFYGMAAGADTIRFEGNFSMDVLCVLNEEVGRDPRTGWPLYFSYGSDFVKGEYYTTSATLTFNPESGSEVDENTAVSILADQNVDIFYMMFESEEAAKAAEWDVEAAELYGEMKPVLSPEKNTIKAAYARPNAEAVAETFFYATYTVKALPAIELTFNPASGSEVKEGTEVTVTANRETEIFYCLYADKAAADADQAFMANAKEVKEDGKPVITKENTFLRCAVYDKGGMKYFDAEYKILTANEGEELAGVSVYPNPTSGVFNIDLPVAATVEVFMANGMLYQRLTLGEGNTTLNINRSGIYFLRITGEGRTAIKRLIVR